jgi:ABC-type glutathione transport system ATPase component
MAATDGKQALSSGSDKPARGSHASQHASVELRGVRTNNLQGVDLDLRLDEVTALTGISGSGKTSLAIGTIAAEARR